MEFSKRVLIVDDEPNVVGVVQEFFARFQHGHAYDVVSAYSAVEPAGGAMIGPNETDPVGVKRQH